jgi:hypothetical protein
LSRRKSGGPAPEYCGGAPCPACSVKLSCRRFPPPARCRRSDSVAGGARRTGRRTPEDDSSGQSRGHVAGPDTHRAQPEQHRPARGNQFPPPSCLPRARIRPRLDISAALKGRTPAGRSPCGEPPDLKPPGQCRSVGRSQGARGTRACFWRNRNRADRRATAEAATRVQSHSSSRARRPADIDGEAPPEVAGALFRPEGHLERGRSGGCLAA